MTERAEALGGQFSCKSKLNDGTEVLVKVLNCRAYIRTNRMRIILWNGFRGISRSVSGWLWQPLTFSWLSHSARPSR